MIKVTEDEECPCLHVRNGSCLNCGNEVVIQPDHQQGEWVSLPDGVGRIVRRRDCSGYSYSCGTEEGANYLLTALNTPADGYDDACETVQEGLMELFSSLGLDSEAYGDDAAWAYVMSQALKRIAEGLKPLGITRDDDTHEFKTNTLADDELVGRINEAGARICAFLGMAVFQLPENKKQTEDLHLAIDVLQECRNRFTALQGYAGVVISKECLTSIISDADSNLARRLIGLEVMNQQDDGAPQEYCDALNRAKENLEEAKQALGNK